MVNVEIKQRRQFGQKNRGVGSFDRGTKTLVTRADFKIGEEIIIINAGSKTPWIVENKSQNGKGNGFIYTLKTPLPKEILPLF